MSGTLGKTENEGYEFLHFGAGAWGNGGGRLSFENGAFGFLGAKALTDHALALSSARENKDYLPGIGFDLDLQIGCELRPVLMECDYVFCLSFACSAGHLPEGRGAQGRLLEFSWQ